MTGLIAEQQAMNIYSNNIANINTVGYKPLRPSFADCVYTIQRETELDWQTGHGAYVYKTDFMYEQSGFQTTEQPLDFAIGGDCYFMVADRDGQTYLTRDGSFNLTNNVDSGQWELVNDAGEYVLDREGNHIPIPFLMGINELGDEYTTTDIDYDALQDAIGLFAVPNNFGLDQADTNHFAVTARSGNPVPVTAGYQLERGYLEMSAVDLATEMVHLIETQRAYQLASKVISTSDELARIANNLR
jgi:flagellar basal-body rod protein FlgG